MEFNFQNPKKANFQNKKKRSDFLKNNSGKIFNF